MYGIGRILVGAGLLVAAVGALLWAGERLFGRPGGLLPGDLVIRRGTATFIFPIVTCIVVSIVLTLLARLFTGSSR